MPAVRPSASFQPISPDLDLAALVEDTPNFEYVVRISCDMIEHQGHEAFEKLVLLHVILGGKPLVIEGFQKRLDEWTFTNQWLKDNHGKKFEQARNLTKQQNMALSMGHYLDNMANLTNQWTRHNYKETDRQRVYLKDIDCPQIWHEKVKEQIPPSVFYLNESTGEVGGPGSLDEKSRGIARAGDLMSSLPPAMRAENLMCYIGHEGTYTPAHREMCASLGQNLMVETSGGRYENGKPTKPGSSIWFMTETKDRHLVSEYWLSTLGHDIEIENHFAQINAWKAAPFNTYIVEQKAGDFILIPPLAPHQVWNRGTRTMKVAWNRTTVETLELALNEALPRARMVCRDEQYKNKAIVLFTLEKYSKLLAQVENQKQIDLDPQVLLELNYSPKIRQLQKDFKRLFSLYTQILLSEIFAPGTGSDVAVEYIPYDSNITCSFCRCNIFNRFLTCPTCIVPLENGEEDTYDICLECYAMGRSCRCNSNYIWVEQFHWQDLVKKHDRWRQQIIVIEGGANDKSPKSLLSERKSLSKKTLAQVCQEQLTSRPWLDPKKPPPPSLSSLARGVPCTEDLINDDGTPKKLKKMKRNKDIVNQYTSCHVCHWPEYDWKLAYCTNCDRAYCYGSLFRGFDMPPLSVMEDPNWKCPYCLKICSCASCRKLKGCKPYEPTITLLGHDTKKVADPRSWEGLVNYSSSNMKWVKNAGDDQPHETRRLHRRRREADAEKSKDAALDDDNYVNEEESMPTSPDQAEVNPPSTEAEIPIDPLLFAEDEAQSRRARNHNADIMQTQAGLNGNATPGSTSSDNLESRLRHGLQNFNEQYDQPTSRLPAPIARMVEEHRQDGKVVSTDVNGITFEYPDETSQDVAGLNGQDQQPVHQGPNAVEANGITQNILQSDVDNGLAEQQRKQIMRQQEILDGGRSAKAKKKRAGQSLLLRLWIDGTKLATIQPRLIGTPQSTSNPDPATFSKPAPPKEILHSDVLDGFKTIGGTVKPPPKRRLTREERDEEFSTRKKPRKAAEPKSKANRTSLPASLNSQPKNYAEDASDSEIEETNSFKPVNGTRKSRGLPAYLARRSLGDHDQPLEQLSTEPKKRTGRPKVSFANNKESEPEPTAEEMVVEEPITNHVPARDAAIAALKAMPSSLTADTQDDVLSISSEDAEAEAIDDYPPEPLPKSRSDVDLSKVGPGQADAPKPAVDEALLRAEENRKAKLRALAWADEDGDDSDEMVDAY